MAPTSKKEITEREAKVLALAWLCFKTQPEVDYVKLAKLAGYTNYKSVINLISNIKKKVDLINAEEKNNGEGPSTPVQSTPKGKAKAPRTPASRKRKIMSGDEGDSSSLATPSRVKHSGGRKGALHKAAAKPDYSEDDEDVVKMDFQVNEQGVPEDVVD
ncbi:hypothetical protein F5B19DRAFT_458960 [Rostrohypoxylon terebratum]|nr:hypothetical protein F5B19DRAFT_458960 [Rostrohypoxylon terebratum]